MEYEYYIYDGMNLVADYDANNGRIIRTYTYGPGIDDIQSITIYDEDGDSETYYYIKDASNTVHVLVDETGLIVEYYYYDAFGNLKMRDEDYNWISESNYGNRFLFQGREYDYATALYYFRSRWYEPETGRWLSPDPIGTWFYTRRKEDNHNYFSRIVCFDNGKKVTETSQKDYHIVKIF